MSRFTAFCIAALVLSACARLEAQQPSDADELESPVEPTIAAQAQEPRRQRPRPLLDSSNTGYVDNAIVGTRFSLRVDRAFGSDNPDRAEFFYAKCGCS